MLTDPIADMLTRIRNAKAVKASSVSMPSSTVKAHIAEVLQKEGFITSFSVEGEAIKTLTINLKYVGGVSAITNLKRISKPGLRVHAKVDELPRVNNGLGIALISTSNGILTDKEARKANLGGEVIAYVW